MNGHLLADAGLRRKLALDCIAHARVVRDVVDAHLAGELEESVALRTCGLELHSLKGVASVLELKDVIAAIGGLCEPLLELRRPYDASFWQDFSHFFMELVACVLACADARAEQAMLDRTGTLRARILAGIGAQERVPQPGPELGVGPVLSPSAGRRLLLVDDSATVRAALAARLSDRGYPVRTARTMEETARLLDEFDPELVVTDVCMPNIEGDELCRRIKALMKRAVPVLLYSNLPDLELATRARAAGANGYICKLSGLEALIERMDSMLGQAVTS